MSMFDFDRPLYTRQLFDDMGIDKDRYYHIAFFNKGKLDTRPIKITGIFTVRSTSAGSRYIRTDATWEYHFETEKPAAKKLIDPVFWDRLFNKYGIVEKKITDKWKIEYKEDWDMLDFYLIGKTEDEAKLKLIMAGLNTPHNDKNGRMEIIHKEYEIMTETDPELIIKAMDWKMDEQRGNITDYSDEFLNIAGDIRND